MNFELNVDPEKKTNQIKQMTIDLEDDSQTSTNSKSLNKTLLSQGPTSDMYGTDILGQLESYEQIIAKDYFVYTMLVMLGAVLSIALMLLYITQHEGIWMIMTCLLESFCLYTWTVGVDAKQKMKSSRQYNFTAVLFMVIIIKAIMFFLGCFSVITWESDTKETFAEILRDNRVKSLILTTLFSFVQFLVAGFLYWKGKLLLDLFLIRESLMGGRERSASTDLIEL